MVNLSLPGTPIIDARSQLPGRFWITSTSSNSAYALEPNATGVLQVVDQINFAPVLAGGGPTALHVDSREHVFVALEGVIVEYEKVGGVWQVVADSPFAGLQAGEHMRLAQSRTNFNPATMTGPTQEDELPTEFPGLIIDCPADIAPGPLGDGSVDVNDLLAVIGGWGPCGGVTPEQCPADIAPDGHGDGAVDVDDLLEVIGGWGPCPR
jgi:hypothetical protein